MIVYCHGTQKQSFGKINIIIQKIDFRFIRCNSFQLYLNPALLLPHFDLGKSTIFHLFTIFISKHIRYKSLISGHSSTPCTSLYNV